MKFEVEKAGVGFRVLLDRTQVAHAKTKGAADRIASALNRALRETTFRPKNAGRRSRDKGHDFERAVAIQLRAIYPEARRHLEYQDGQCFGVDIAEVGSLRVQCKKLHSYASVNTIDEIEAERPLGEIPVLVTAADGKPPMAVVHLEDFLYILEKSSVR